MTSSRLWAAALFALTGCGPTNSLPPVRPEVARETLRATLDGWKAGRPIEALAQDTPPVIAQDADWSAGAKLEAYELLRDGDPKDANLWVPVKLTLRGKGTRTVTYIVGTEGRRTVFRAL